MKNPREGLPEHLFKYISSVTPMLNVDLLVFNPDQGVLLSWRKDKFYGPGWHIPGGIIRFKENFIDRLNYVAKNEIKINGELEYRMVSIHQIMNPSRDVRGHFISLLFVSEINSKIAENIKTNTKNYKSGDLSWHKFSPKNIIPQHIRYSQYINKVISNDLTRDIDIGNVLDNYNEEDEKQY